MKALSFYHKIFLFQDLDNQALEEILALAVPREYEAGEVIVREGEPGDTLFIMESGEVEITKALTLVLDEEVPKERLMVRLTAEDGGCFGEMALLENEVRSATVSAVTPCRLLELHRDDFLDYVRAHPQEGCQLLLRLAQRLSSYLRKSSQDVVKLTTALAIALGG